MLIDELKLEHCELLYDKVKIDSIYKCLEELQQMKEERSNLNENKSIQDIFKDKTSSALLSSIKTSINSQATKSEEKNYSYFFQEKNGDIYFLHPINYNVLLSEYDDEESIPTEITGKILEIESYQMSPMFKNKFNTLNHLRDGNIFYLVEIDLKPLVSNIALKQYHLILKERSKARNLIKDEEEHYDIFVQKMYLKFIM